MTNQVRTSMIVVLLGIVPGCPLGERLIGELDDEATDNESSDGPVEDLPIGSDSMGSDSTTDDCGPDTSGIYLLALETQLGPDVPLQFVLTLDVLYAGDCSALGNFSFQPLSLDPGSQTQPREFIGEPLILQDVALDAEGNFSLDMGLVMVSGMANPITNSDIEATLMLDGHVVHVDALCGDVTGMLMSPLEYDLAGSTFAAIRLADDGSNPDTLPMPIYRCNQVPPAP